MFNRSALKSLVLGVAALASLVLWPARALSDTLHLKDGRTLSGTVAKEVNGYVWFKVKVGDLESEQMFTPEQIDKLDRDTPAKPDAAAAKTEEKPAADSKPRTGVPRIAVITLGGDHDSDMVGLFITAEELKRLVKPLEDEHVTDVVFRVNSGGGSLGEVQPLSDEIQNEYKQKFRVVAWVKSAISAAAMTSHCIEDIYLTQDGNYGACTAWRAGGEAAKGRELEEILYMAEKISARGKHDLKIMRSMQIMEPLSCTIDENGEVHWYQNLDGDFIVNPKERILCFNSEDAVKYKFAKGIADDLDTLAKEMGYTEYQLVGKSVPGVPYPICKAEEDNIKFRDLTLDAQKRANQYAQQYNEAIQRAKSSPPDERGKFIGIARQTLDNIRRVVRQNPNLRTVFGFESMEQFKNWLDEQEQLLRELMKK